MAKRIAMTNQERAERRKHEQQLTQQAVAQLRWLTVRARVGLRRYSVRNQLLIALQDPRATHVAGFRAWLRLGYCVKRGESSHIRVWAPCPPSKKNLTAWRAAGAIAEDRSRTYFRLEAVFSATQVEALAPPAGPAPLDPPFAEVQGDSLAWATGPLQQLARDLGYDVAYETLQPGHGGSCNPTAKRVTINSDQAVNAQADVLCHELAHVLVRVDRHDDDPQLGYAEEELVAESVAHLAVSSSALTPARQRSRTWPAGRNRRHRTRLSRSPSSSTASPAAWRTRSARTRRARRSQPRRPPEQRAGHRKRRARVLRPGRTELPSAR